MAYKFCSIALHGDRESAQAYFEDRAQLLPWTSEAREVWSATLRPIRHVGKVNFLDRNNPDLIYDCPPEAIPTGPLVVLTTAGFNEGEELDQRALDFYNGVGSVRASMTGMPGLHSQQVFTLDGADGMTVTLWRDFASLREFAYGPGAHKDHLMRQREGWADRTSFTRCVVERSDGVWHGSIPFA